MFDDEEQRIHFHNELSHAAELLIQEPSFDNLSDAAEVLTRAANRVAPIGHSVRLVRDSLDVIETERHGVTREAR